MRRLVAVLALTAGCGGRAAPPPSAPSSTNADPTPPPVVQPVLVLGVELRTGRFAVMPDGTLVDDDGVASGRLDEDGTLYRADGTIFARVSRDGRITLEPPTRVRDESFGGMRIEGSALVTVEDGEDREVEHVEDGAIVSHGRHHVVEGLTPDRVRTVLAADALVFAMLLESAGIAF